MLNTKFEIGFPINREEFKKLMNDERYKDIIYLSVDDSTGNPQVKTYMYGNPWVFTKQQSDDSQKKPVYKYLSYRISKRRSRIRSRPYLKYINNKSKNENSYITFVTFSSAQTIVSWSNIDDLAVAIGKFFDIIEPNVDKIREVIGMHQKAFSFDD
jgi:hypothetical protein